MTFAVRSWIRQNPVIVTVSLRPDVSSADANWRDMSMKDDGVDNEERGFSRLGLCGVTDSCFCCELYWPARMRDDSVVCSWW